MRGKTPNTHHPTSNAEFKRNATPVIEWAADGVRVTELPNADYGVTREVQRYDLENRLLDFAVSIVELTESLPNTRAGNHIAGQLLRCGTSPLSNHGEVEAAESRKDFVHKLRICLKEMRETRRWLRLAGRLKKLGSVAGLPVCLSEIDELIRIFAASVRTAEKNAK
jgi:four helix bundle protein